MKVIKSLLLLTLVGVFSLQLLAQNQLEDVVYLNNGSIYRGVIIEEVPNVSLKIRIMGGSVVAIAMGDITKKTKEPFYTEESPAPETVSPVRNEPRPERVKTPFEPRKKGYFFQGQLMLEIPQAGFRVVNGYKFGRFGHLGIGVGLDLVGGSVFNGPVNDLDVTDLAGVYLPLYLYYAGDILQSRITPFYAIEAGYTHPLNSGSFGGGRLVDDGFGGSSITLDRGIAMGSVGVGVRFNTARRVNFSLLLNVEIKSVQYSEEYYIYDDFSGVYDSYGVQNQNATLIIGGLRFGIGF